jgi:DNA/RNA endonuclease YhcR with UshA esterase domain
MMIKLKYILFLFLLPFLLSCGKKEDTGNLENTEDKTEQPSEKKEEPKEQLTSKTDSVSASSKELKFYNKTEKPEAVISAVEASEYIGKVVTVKGFVADVYKTERVAYLNFIEKFPKNPFSGVIFYGKFDAFGDLNIYEGKNVSITGRVTVYKEKPQIILDSKEQIKISE